MALTPTHKALILKNPSTKELAVIERPLPVRGDEDILIQIKATTLNPTDWKHVYGGFLQEGPSFGCNFAGAVVDVGKDTNGWKVGDAAAGFVRGGIPDSDNGAFQGECSYASSDPDATQPLRSLEYIKVNYELAWHVPTNVLSWADAAAMGGVSLSTAVQCLYHRLDLPPPWEPTKDATPIVVWSGATSLGTYAIKLATLSGFKVATTASPKNDAFVKELGAEVVFDYKDPDAPLKIKDWADGKLAYGLDTITENGSTRLVARAFGGGGGLLVTSLPSKRHEDGSTPENLRTTGLLISTVLDKKVPADRQRMVEWYKQIPKLVKDLKVLPIKHWDGGLEAIPEALEYLRAGKASREKIAITVS